MGETHKGLRASVASADALGEDCHITTTSAEVRALLEDHDEHRATAAYLNDVLQAHKERLAERDAEVERLRDALQAAVDCGMVPKMSASEGGAALFSEQVRVADQIRAALTPQETEK